MEGPLLVLKSWMLTALAIWIYKRWFQRVAPPAPEFEAFCAGRPVVGAMFGLAGDEARVAALLASKLGERSFAVATLGGYPWPHYRLALTVERREGGVLLRVSDAQVMRTKERQLPALASVVRDVLNTLPAGAEAWLHSGAFNNGLVTVPDGGWALERGHDKRPRFRPLTKTPTLARASFGFGEPDAALLAIGHGVNDSVPGVAR